MDDLKKSSGGHHPEKANNCRKECLTPHFRCQNNSTLQLSTFCCGCSFYWCHVEKRSPTTKADENGATVPLLPIKRAWQKKKGQNEIMHGGKTTGTRSRARTRRRHSANKLTSERLKLKLCYARNGHDFRAIKQAFCVAADRAITTEGDLAHREGAMRRQRN